MSFWPSVYDRIFTQDKTIEFRQRYSNEETIVYMYVSKPCMAIKGIAILGKRINMSTISKNSSFYLQAVHDGYQIGKYTYGMPILSFQTIVPIPLTYIKSKISDFHPPQSYYYLDNNTQLLHIIESNTKPITDVVCNSFVFPEVVE